MRLLILSLTTLMIACGSSGFDDGGLAPNEFSDTGAPGAGFDGGTSPGDTFEPEEELVLQVPEAARDFVFVASTTLDSVAKIDAETLEIESLPVGDKPTVVRTRPTINTAAVLNSGSADVSIIHAARDEEALIRRVKVQPFLNAMVMSPSGDHTVLYFDDSIAEEGERAGSLQDIEIVRTRRDEETSVSLRISFHVQEIFFNDDSTQAYIVTDDYLHIIDLEAVIADPTSHDPANRITLDDQPLEAGVDREVTLTPDGAFAIVRDSSEPTLTLIELATNERATVTLRAAPSDLDLLPEGDGVIAVIRASTDPETLETEPALLVLLELPAAFDDPESATTIEVPDIIPVGQVLVAPESSRAIVFTTVGSSRTLGDFDFATQTLVPHRLGSDKAIEGAVLSPDGRFVYVAHSANTTSSDPVQQLDGFSVVDFQSDAGLPFDKLYQTDAPTSNALFTESGSHLITLVNAPARGARQVILVELGSLRMDIEDLGSPPVLLGSMPSTQRAYVSQEHPVGRISFIELANHRIQTVTGFELNSRIR